MSEPKKKPASSQDAIKPTDVANGFYVLGDVYADVDTRYFAESPLATGILRGKRSEPAPGDGQ